MKKLIYLSAIALIFACSKPEKPIDYLVFSGNIENNTADSIFVLGEDFKNGIAIDSSGAFSDTLRMEDGYYSFRIGRESSAMYLQKKQHVSLAINVEEFDESILFEGPGSKENNYLAQNYLLDERLIPSGKELYMQDEAAFIKQVKTLRDESKSMLSKMEINEEFRSFQEKESDYAFASKIVNYQGAHRYYADTTDFIASEAFYENQIDFALDNEEAFRSSDNYRSLISSVFSNNISNLVSEKDSSFIGACKSVARFLGNQHIKNEVINDFSYRLLKPTKMLDSALIFLKDNVTNTDYINNYDDQYDKMLTILPGEATPSFMNYENHNGDSTSLSDFSGKYVYIDVWATWCGPCIAEIPALKQLEADMHGKNIEFLSISVDRENAHETWINMVNEKELGGTQLFADKSWQSEFTQAYSINSIPRFILIDPQGNIVDADAKRPSNSELREEFKELGI